VSSKGAYVGENQMAGKNGKNWLKKTPYFKLAKCVSFGCLCSREFTHRIKSISLQQGGNEVQLHPLNIS
jgi:hypothetical protein